MRHDGRHTKKLVIFRLDRFDYSMVWNSESYFFIFDRVRKNYYRTNLLLKNYFNLIL